MATEHRELLSGYVRDVWNNGDSSAMGRYLSADVVCHDPYQPTIVGLDDATLFVDNMRETFADCQIQVEDTVEEGEYIACRLRHS